jgi:hypothetical protein
MKMAVQVFFIAVQATIIGLALWIDYDGQSYDRASTPGVALFVGCVLAYTFTGLCVYGYDIGAQLLRWLRSGSGSRSSTPGTLLAHVREPQSQYRPLRLWRRRQTGE